MEAMEPVEVMGRFDRLGQMKALRVIWRGKEYLIESTGRRWKDAAGQHLLVMAPGGKAFELLYREERWFMVSSNSGPMNA